MRQLLALCLGFAALAAASRSPLVQRAVDMVLEDFHSKSHVQWAHREQAVEDVIETDYLAGPFVQLRLTLRQTQCQNQPGRSQDCAFRRNGRKRSCRACFKFDVSLARVLDQYVHCMAERQLAVTDMARRDAEECEAVQQAGEALYHPGRFAFSKALPS
ncbi:retinoic acid receptor responder protein 2 [Emydura macquarii macquarii]|uniref:retinoic acid receptor responder protein 2 n=1 Tax=Emydura macquarii macquarii TaxID=1129001 RepID=UPI003529EC24